LTFQSRGEAMKKITVLIFFVFSSTLSAQGSTDVVQYYQQLKAQGFTDQQIQDLAKQNGYDINNMFSEQKKIFYHCKRS